MEEERKELKHEGKPVYRLALYIAIAVAVIYLAVLFYRYLP